MKFLSVEGTNFAQFESFHLPLDAQDVMLVLGENLDSPAANSNAAGKSNLAVESWLWACFGRTAGGRSGDAVIRQHSDGNCEVKLHLELEDGAQYTIKRTQGRSNSLQLCGQDGLPLPSGDKRDTQQAVTKLLGFDFDTARQALVLGQGGIPFAGLTDSAQKETLEKILGIDEFAQYRKKARAKIASLEMTKKQRQVDKVNLASQTEHLKAQLVALNQALEELVSARERRQRSIDEEIFSLQATIDRGVQAGEVFKKIEEEARELQKEWRNYSEKVSSSKQRLAREIGDLARQVKEGYLYISGLRQQIQTSEFEGACPLCRRPFDKEYKEQVLASLTSQLTKKEEEVVAAQALLATRRVEEEATNHVDGHIEELTKKISQADVARTTALRDVQDCEKASTRKDQLLQERVSWDVRFPQQERAKKETEALLLQTEGQLKQADATLVAIEEDLPYWQFWDLGWSNGGLKSFLLDSVTPFLNARANKYSTVLTNGDIEIEFTTTIILASGEKREQFSVLTHERSTGVSGYEGNSGGLRQRVDICVALALQDFIATRANRALNFRVFDEIFVNLDTEGVSRVVRLLQELKQTVGTLFVITHDADLQALLPKAVMVRKHGGIATVRVV